MIKYLLLVFLLITNVHQVVSQTTLELYPNGTACRYSLSIDAGDTIWGGSLSSGLQKCYNDTCISLNTTNSSINSNYAYAVSVDSSDKIWIGGNSGLSVFDHSNWISYNTANSALSSDTIKCIASTISGTWVGTNKGLNYFDGTTWIIYNIQNSGIYSDTIVDIAADANQVFVAHGNNISRFNGTWTTWNVSNATQLELAAGRLWSTSYTANTLRYLDQGIFISFDSLLNNLSPRTPFYRKYMKQDGIASDKSGNLYFSSYFYNVKCIYRISPALKLARNMIDPSVASFIPFPQNIFSNDIIYMSGPLSGLRVISLDTSLFLPAQISGTSNDFLDVNNSTVRLLNRGDMHWDPVEQVPGYFSDLNSFRHPVYCSAMWLGGIDQGGQLHTAAMQYRQQGAVDFWTGPLDTINGVADTISQAYYDRFWKIDYDMIQGFIINYQNGNVQNGTYTIPEAIATWPAHGTGNHSRDLAPFIDVNNDGVYNPYDGDYPELTGHQTLWWIFNDAAYMHTETQGMPFEFEIEGKAYGYNCNMNSAADEVMNNTTFYQYKITNRSTNTYHDVYIGLWTDYDLGNASDDYVGCDTMLNTYFCYNGDNDDDGNYGYGLNPPMMDVTFLKGPVLQAADNIDNNRNGLIDEPEETSGMSHFRWARKSSGMPYGRPITTDDYYDHLTGHFNDGTPISFGGNGYDPGNPDTTMYQFSGNPFITAPTNWTMASASMQPDDMRAFGSAGPFTIAPGESQSIDFAYIFTRDSINPNGLTTSIAKNTADVQKIINGFNSGNYPCLTTVGMPTLSKQNLTFNLYPNPATDAISFNKEMIGAKYEIYNITGQLVKSGVYFGTPISTENLSSQLYIVKAIKDDSQYTKRFVKM